MGTGNGELVELYVELDEDGEFFEQPACLSTAALAERFIGAGVQLGRGQVAEICLDLKPFFQNVCQVVERGYVIFIDYGDRASNLYSHRHRNGTLRSYYQQQQIHDVFFAVGLQDLTADVDYTAVLSIAEEVGFEKNGLVSQGTWLRNLGIETYRECGGGDRESDRGDGDVDEVDVLTRPAGLGSAFDVLIFKTKGLPDGPGLEPAS
jgi:SAM-dependent MidA family methyltransferase